ncbi:MAG: PqqD family protein [Synergistaceae bacterium]|nr:PqqD family protein [Synergistaceae bacterium]
MNTPYEFIKGYIPIKNALKTRENDSFLIVANRESNVYYLNGTGREIWENIDGSKSINEICECLLSEYDVSREVLERDLTSFVRDMQWKKLLRLKKGG